MLPKSSFWSALLAVGLTTVGCGQFVARRIVQAPNTYPAWLAPAARVELAFAPQLLTNFPARFIEVGPPPALLRYRLVEPADYGFEVNSTNWWRRSRQHFRFSFRARLPGQTNVRAGTPRGTVVLLHGYGLSEFAMTPWALRLAEEGWRCVLLDLRGHGKSTGRRVYLGLQETHDLSQLLDALDNKAALVHPVAALGDSYGAALALRWKTSEPRLDRVVAISPYAVLSNAVLNLCHEHAPLLPPALVKAGLRRLPALLGTKASELDTLTVLKRTPTTALFVAGSEDRVVPVEEVQELCRSASGGSGLLVVDGATHESLPYWFSELAPAVLSWLAGDQEPPGSGHQNRPSE